MNSYLITDMPGTTTVGALDRAIFFYKQLCYELIAFAVEEDVVRYLTPDQAHVLRSFRHAFQKINAGVLTTEFKKRSLLQEWKTLLNQLIVFYKNSEFNNTEAPDIVKGRWYHVRLRAEKWQERALRYHWEYCLCIFPALTQEPWWHGAAVQP